MVNQNCFIVEAKLFLRQLSLSVSDSNVYKLHEEHAIKIWLVVLGSKSHFSFLFLYSPPSPPWVILLATFCFWS